MIVAQRLSLVLLMAMLHKSKIVFLDEPTIGLDLISKERIRLFIRETNKSGVTFILTTHDLSDIEHLAERVIVINHGNIVFDDSLAKLKKHTGAKKMIKISSHNEIGNIDIKGAAVTKPLSNHEIELVLDLNETGLNTFIERIGAQLDVSDLLIEELPIESIIKELYLSDSSRSANTGPG